MLPLIVALVVVAIVLVIAVSVYNRLTALRERTRTAFSQIDVQLERRYDLILRNRTTGATSGTEIKSSANAMNRFDAPARQQFAADRWINTNGGATSVGSKGGITIDSTYKIQWPP